MIIDVHGHLCASPKLYAWFTLLLASRATYGTLPPPFSDDELLSLPETRRNLDAIDLAGTDVQLMPLRSSSAKTKPLVASSAFVICSGSLPRLSAVVVPSFMRRSAKGSRAAMICCSCCSPPLAISVARPCYLPE